MARITLLDGGLSRELENCGAELRQPEWSALALMEKPEAVLQAHRNFLKAGAQVLTTNSYALVPFHIGAERFGRDALGLAARAGKLAREAADEAADGAADEASADESRTVRVAGSIPPLFGSYRPDLFDAARAPDLLAPLIEGLAPYADFWLVETISSLIEARTVFAGLKPTEKPVWLSFTLEDAIRDVPRLRSGESVEESVQLAAGLGADALLFNCSAPEVMEAAVRLAADLLAGQGKGIPVGVYANAFVEKSDDDPMVANETITPVRKELTPERYRDFARSWVDAGARIIGGCCGIGPDHIAALRDL
ncbi:homocysteine S-methyltransferase family protein [Denitrobaculum tricleocarpae]|uniref:Homocysteine S-methyltransferase family protein n=1 Tax=Denitrobaculum tricleocarpae TaxID=2591009 RepID=A0A545TKW3_9PROT|nr:homocysteine S-methyltransferase family protein [Denitrobaculum tricleocarpae]TQV77863.1 homocysteine S-methyltransferase family protein [Denitrobaculum tricleocarpae]